jgi:dihydroorotate dehydrogenase electron transfer subunit
MRTTEIMDVKEESPTVKTFVLEDVRCSKAKPGQFLMLWIPEIDEIPLSILKAEDTGRISISVKIVGEATRLLHNKRPGDVVGVRGPFGKGFTLRRGRILTVCGGSGAIPILFLVRNLVSSIKSLTCLMGAETKEELLFLDEFRVLEDSGVKVIATTEDDSYGVKGLVTDKLQTVLEKERFDMMYTCGPEHMMKRVLDLAYKHKIRLEASLERIMRCAVGLCGSCAIGKYRVCRDGPVFSGEQLREVKTEFGISKMAFNGKQTQI